MVQDQGGVLVELIKATMSKLQEIWRAKEKWYSDQDLRPCLKYHIIFGKFLY